MYMTFWGKWLNICKVIHDLDLDQTDQFCCSSGMFLFATLNLTYMIPHQIRFLGCRSSLTDDRIKDYNKPF